MPLRVLKIDAEELFWESVLDDLKIDREAMGRLAKALTFICGAEHATTVALKTASETGTDQDIKRARTAFMKLKSSERNAALAMLKG
jgi:hypothetical protein